MACPYCALVLIFLRLLFSSMTRRFLYSFLFVLLTGTATAQVAAERWADSIMATLSKDERIAQLMVVRLSAIDPKTRKVSFYDKQVEQLIRKYNIGGICAFQGSPTLQVNAYNRLQQVAKTPVLMCIDGEWGLGMRMTDSILPLPKQMMLGAMPYDSIVYAYGKLVAEQCKRVGIQVNYAPVVDVNNNRNNPVINDRSFGEDKYKVARFGIAYMKGMQDNGVMATAKHFPGHGDVAVDSHLDLPVINKSRAELDSLELFPFRELINAGVASIMNAHLYIPSIDNRPNRATSISDKAIKHLLRDTLGFTGLTFTDALEMQGVNKFFPNGQAAVESLIAGNDMLCLPSDIPATIAKIKQAIKSKRLSWDDIDNYCRKVLIAKYNYGLGNWQPSSPVNVTEDVNAGVPEMRRLVAENAITLLSNKNPNFFPLNPIGNNLPGHVAVVALGTNSQNTFTSQLKKAYSADVFFFDYKNKSAPEIGQFINRLKDYNHIIIGVHGLSRSASTNYGISKDAVEVQRALQNTGKAITYIFGNPYLASNFCNAGNLVVCYEDDDIVQGTAVDLLTGKLQYKGSLPVSVCPKFLSGFGIPTEPRTILGGNINDLGFYEPELNKIDSIAIDAISRRAIPGCVIMAVKDGEIAYHKAFGNTSFYQYDAVTPETVYDIASVTKIAATTLAVMKLYEQDKLNIYGKLGDYLPNLRGTDKENLSIEKVLLHQAGLVSYIPFYKATLVEFGDPNPSIYSETPDSGYIQVADRIYMRPDYIDTMFATIAASKLGPGRYVYSDNDFIYLGKIVEAISGKHLDEYVNQTFYKPMGLQTIGFRPLERLGRQVIAATEDETIFRRQLIRGYVHDPAAAMFGGVSGHAGLFSNAYDLAALFQMMQNGGIFNGRRYLKSETIEAFTIYNSTISRRGYGFDKPEKDNGPKAKSPYPGKYVSAATYGHTGFTGTCLWVDPVAKLTYIFLGNRINSDRPSLFINLKVREKILDQFYISLQKGKQNRQGTDSTSITKVR